MQMTELVQQRTYTESAERKTICGEITPGVWVLINCYARITQFLLKMVSKWQNDRNPHI